MQVLSEVVFVHGTRMAEAGLQLSNVSKPLRTKVRTMFRGKAPILRRDMHVMGGLYFAPRSTVQQQLAACAPRRWAELIVGLPDDPGAPLFRKLPVLAHACQVPHCLPASHFVVICSPCAGCSMAGVAWRRMRAFAQVPMGRAPAAVQLRGRRLRAAPRTGRWTCCRRRVAWCRRTSARLRRRRHA